MRRLLIPALILLSACATSMTPRANSRPEVVAYVDRAAAAVSAGGIDVCDGFKGRRWFSDHWYIFMFDANGRTVCHPARPEQIGAMAADLVDSNGKRFGDEMMRVAAAGGGWVDYMFPRPGQNAPERKSAYVKQVKAPDGKTYVVGSGGYDLP